MDERTVLIACKTLEDEVRHVLDSAGLRMDIEWMESGLHNTPRRLHDKLQAILDGMAAEVRRVLLGFGNCGNAVHQLRTGDFELVIPRVDDCISLLLGSDEHREELNRRFRGIYLTEGWMRGERTLVAEYRHMLDRYGAETTEDVIRATYANYRSICLLDTGAYDVASLLAESAEIAAVIGLKQEVVPATTAYLAELVCGPWPAGRFLTVPPNSELDSREFI